MQMLDVKREDEERNIINALSRQRCQSYTKLKTPPETSLVRLYTIDDDDDGVFLIRYSAY